MRIAGEKIRSAYVGGGGTGPGADTFRLAGAHWSAVVSRPAHFLPDETISSGDRRLHVVAEAGRESAVVALVTEQTRKYAPPTDT